MAMGILMLLGLGSDFIRRTEGWKGNERKGKERQGKKTKGTFFSYKETHLTSSNKENHAIIYILMAGKHRIDRILETNRVTEMDVAPTCNRTILHPYRVCTNVSTCC
jgi:hypothetical protein